MRDHGKIALITTAEYRSKHDLALGHFLYRNLHSLSRLFEIWMTGGTYDHVMAFIAQPPGADSLRLIEDDTQCPCKTASALADWRRTIVAACKRTEPGIVGMIEIGYALVEAELGAILHFIDYSDTNAKADTAVLWREANVHDIPIAVDPDTAATFVQGWRETFSRGQSRLEVTQIPSGHPLSDIKAGDDVIALIAHDNKKLDMCQFVVENDLRLFDRCKYILATGTTGRWVTKFAIAAGRSRADIDKIRLCSSGPFGGDVQIAYAVIKGLCRTVFFFQDPQVSHPHDADIRLFEQATVSVEPRARFATNAAAAKLLLLGI